MYDFELKVTDNNGATGKDTIQVTVNAAANIPPVANAGSDITIMLPINSVVLSGTGTDADGSIVIYKWRNIAGPSQFSIISPAQSQTIVSSLTQGAYTFELTVTDNTGVTATDTVGVLVISATNRAPIAEAGNNKIITLPIDSLVLEGKGVDSDGTIIGYNWRQVSGPGQYRLLSPGSPQTIVDQLVEGTYVFELRVTDNFGATATDTLQVLVKTIDISQVTIFPNPARNIVNIKIDANTPVNLTSLVIYSVSGTPVYEEVFMRYQPSMIKQVDVSKLPNGIYFAEVSVNINRKLTVKLLKQ